MTGDRMDRNDRQEEGWKHYLRLLINIGIPGAGWLLLCLLGPKLLAFFMPFVIGWVLAMIANPLVRFLERRLRLVRKHSSLLIVAGALALVIGVIYLLVSRSISMLGAFIRDLPELYASMEADVMRSMEQADRLLLFLPDDIQKTWSDMGSNLGSYLSMAVEKAASPTMEAAGTVAKSIPAMLVYSVVTILSAYFFIVYREPIMEFIRGHMPQWAQGYQLYLKREVCRLVSGYFMAQFKIMGVVWFILTAGFLVLGVGYAPLWGLLIAFLDFLPVFGTGTVLVPWGIIKLLGGEYAFAAGLLLLYVLTQVIRQVVQPKLVGDSMGLNPLLTLFLLYLGFKMNGIAGMILAVPLGMFFVNLYHYGAFRNITENFRTLVRDINEFRRR